MRTKKAKKETSLNDRIKLFVVDYVTSIINTMKVNKVEYNGKPSTAIWSKDLSLYRKVNEVFKTDFDGKEIFEKFTLPLVKDKKLFTIPCKRKANGMSNGYMISITPFTSTNKSPETVEAGFKNLDLSKYTS